MLKTWTTSWNCEVFNKQQDELCKLNQLDGVHIGWCAMCILDGVHHNTLWASIQKFCEYQRVLLGVKWTGEVYCEFWAHYAVSALARWHSMHPLHSVTPCSAIVQLCTTIRFLLNVRTDLPQTAYYAHFPLCHSLHHFRYSSANSLRIVNYTVRILHLHPLSMD